MSKKHRSQFSRKLILSLIVISAINVLDTKFFGTVRSNPHSFVSTQIAHIAALVAIAAIGYYNWKDHEEEWLKHLWVVLYGAVLLLLGFVGVLYLADGANVRYAILLRVPAIKSAFTSPLPFFAFYLLTFANKAMAPREDKKI